LPPDADIAAPLAQSPAACSGLSPPPRFAIAHFARLNFNETNYIVAPCGQVNLAFMLRRPLIPRHDHVAQCSQVEESVFFSARTNLPLLW